MSDYVSDQDLFSQFTQDSDWINPNEALGEPMNARLHAGEPSEADYLHQLVDPSLFHGTNSNAFIQEIGGILDNAAHQILPVSLYEDGSYSPLGSRHGSTPPESEHEPLRAVDDGTLADTASLPHLEIPLECKERMEALTSSMDGSEPEPTQDQEYFSTNSDPKKRKPRKDLRCTFAACQETRSFGRQAELDRHMRKHTGNVALACPVNSCNRRGNRAFYREDKLEAHIRSVHDDDELCSCPVPTCGKGPLQFDLFLVHMHVHGGWGSGEVHVLFKYAEERRCPIKKCRIGRSPWKRSHLIPGPNGHLMAHDETERQENRISMLNNGYDAASGGLVCPICKEVSSDQNVFRQHLEKTHTTLTEHGRSFLDAIWSRPTLKDISVSSLWEEVTYRVQLAKVRCPVCSYVHEPGSDETSDKEHHRQLVDTDELYRHRREILRIRPNFWHHSVFADVVRSV